MEVVVGVFGYGCVVGDVVFDGWFVYVVCVEYLCVVYELYDVLGLWVGVWVVEEECVVGWWVGWE